MQRLFTACPGATGTSGTSTTAINHRSLDFSFRECLFSIFEVQGRDSRQGPDPLGKPQPDLGALHAGDCGIHVLPRQ